MSPNAYYNYLKNRKNEYRERKCKIQRCIVSLYHREDGVPGYRQMQSYLNQEGWYISPLTCHRYMRSLGLKSIVRRRKPAYMKGHAHKVFANLLNRNFAAEKPNQLWATDFTYLPMADGTMHYNCTIIDLYDRYAVATLNGASITADLAIRTLEKALRQHKPGKGLILHSDQGVQFTSKVFNDFCERHHVQQSMSQAGCPYDNAPMERFYNTLKNEYFNLRKFKDIESLNIGIYRFVYCHYNRKRPHSYNGGQTPWAARLVA
jgi:transposase InsO family protein